LGLLHAAHEASPIPAERVLMATMLLLLLLFLLLQVRWIRAMYTDFQSFTRDQEMLISTQKKAAVEDAAGTFDYVEGIVIINNDNPYNGWKSVPFAPQELNSSSMIPKDAGSLLYYIELAKGFDPNNIHAMEQVLLVAADH